MEQVQLLELYTQFSNQRTLSLTFFREQPSCRNLNTIIEVTVTRDPMKKENFS